MHSQAMLEASPVQSEDAARTSACIEACLDCSQTCTACANACLHEQDMTSLVHCISLDEQCADICDATARLLSRPGDLEKTALSSLLAACEAICSACAKECEQHSGMSHCTICAEVCRRCEEACAAVRDPWKPETFELSDRERRGSTEETLREQETWEMGFGGGR